MTVRTMTTKVVPVRPTEFERIHDSLLVRLNPSIPQERWRRLFDWGWANPEDHTGFALVDDGGSFVGFVATIYSERSVRGRVERFCNLSSWIVLDGYRSSGVGLIMPVLRRTDLTVTNLTSIPAVNRMFRSLGFQTLETHTRVCFPISGMTRVNRGSGGFEIVEEPSMRDPTLPDRIRGDLAALTGRCLHWLVRSKEGPCHLAFTLSRRRRLPTIRLHHVSDPSVFAAALPQLGLRFLFRYRAPQFETDERLLGDLEIPQSQKIALPETRLFRSRSVEAREISNLYSELPLLNL